ncbi:hypothetical protein [Promicromonospora sp. NFX87]|uniref:hypothetical protein n=1 Tax=Promicromonospora sp. NFX87 TaxID=3402691 RepID=UPI003AFB7A4F
MAVTSRLRKIPPSMFADEVLLELPAEVRLTGLGLRFFANDQGRQTANPTMVKAQVWPLTQAVGEEQVEEHLVALEDAGYIRLYVVGGRTYFQLVEWPSVDNRSQEDFSRVPPPPSAARSGPDTSIQTLAVVEREKSEGVGGGEGELRVGAGEAPQGTRSRLMGTPKPSPFCKRHPDGTDHPCAPCGRARLAHGEWVEAQMEAELEELGAAS